MAIEDELQKMQYHIRLLADTLDPQVSPIASLVLGFNWTEKDLDNAHDIFEKYDGLLGSGEPASMTAMEHELRRRFGIGYQSVKTIVLAFFRNSQWTKVCVKYALAHTTVEMHEIINAFKRDGTMLADEAASIIEKAGFAFERWDDATDFIVTVGDECLGIEIKALTSAGQVALADGSSIRSQMRRVQAKHQLARIIVVVPDTQAVNGLRTRLDEIDAQNRVKNLEVCSIWELEARLRELAATR